MKSLLLPLMLLVCAPAAALAAKVPKVAVLDVKTVGKFDPQTVAGLSSLIASTAAGHPQVKAVTGSDLVALLGLERQKELLGCSDTSCLTQLAGGLAVEYLITSEVSEVGGRWLLSIALLDVAKATSLSRLTRQALTPGGLVDLVPGTVSALLSALPSPRSAPPLGSAPPGTTGAGTATASSAPAATATPAASPAPAAAVSAAPAEAGAAQRIAGWTLVGVAAAALVVGIVSGVDAKLDYDAAVNRASEADVKRIDSKLWVADGMFLAAAALGATGLAVALTAPSGPEAKKTTLRLAPTVGGGAVVLSGGF